MTHAATLNHNGRPATGPLANGEATGDSIRKATGGAARVVFYEGERIYFSPLEPADEPLLRRWINDPRIWPTLHHRGPVNQDRERDWIASIGKDDAKYVFGIVVRQDDRLIGACGLHAIHPVDRRAEFGISIGEPDLHNRGYGTEATRLTLRYGFEELNLHRIGLSVFASNPRAIRAYQKAGFVAEGCHRRAIHRRNRSRISCQ